MRRFVRVAPDGDGTGRPQERDQAWRKRRRCTPGEGGRETKGTGKKNRGVG